MLTHTIPDHADTWTTVDRTDWGPGPWDDEPDKVSWTDPTTGRPCLITRHEVLGHLCGYAAVDPGHVLHGVPYEPAARLLHVGREINYSAYCEPNAPEESGVCHVPKPGAPHDVWWFGFHCGHAWDLSPGSIARLPEHLRGSISDGQTYRDLDNVRTLVQALAIQLDALSVLPAGPVREVLELKLPELPADEG